MAREYVFRELYFDRTRQRLSDARHEFEELFEYENVLRNPSLESDGDKYKRLLGRTIRSLREVTFVLQKEGKRHSWFDAWYAERQEYLRADPIMRTIVDMRNQAEKQGYLPIEFNHRYQIQFGATPRPSDGARPFIGAEGAYWVVDEGTPRQRDIAVRPGDEEVILFRSVMSPTLQVPLRNPATGEEYKLPYQICLHAICILEEILHEATDVMVSKRMNRSNTPPADSTEAK
jgi:hypothetical protein